VVRINSQSGKGGVAYVMGARHGMNLPPGMRADFARVTQQAAEHAGELSPEEIRRLFEREYLSVTARIDRPVTAALHVEGADPGCTGLLAVSLAAWDVDVYMVHHIGGAVRDEATVYAECMLDGQPVWGAGRGRDVVAASRAAVGSALARAQTPSAR
jgi:2-isopropylmalate synthase